jgi:hypothetical protein
MYEAEVKWRLVQYRFPPSEGWQVTVHLDPMELARGGTHPTGKAEAAALALAGLNSLGVTIGIDRAFQADIHASHPSKTDYVVEAKGESELQKEVALYSALGQLILKVGPPPWQHINALAFPDSPLWERQFAKVPHWLFSHSSLQLLLVSPEGVRQHVLRAD